MNNSDDLNCPICQEYFKNVLETPCCSQGYCSECLDNALKSTGGNCPSCRQNISIFSCTPNKMIQRMVDNLPAECLYCPAKLTRSIVEEHIQKCDRNPSNNNGNWCDLHKQPFSGTCSKDKMPVCKFCTLVGRHRHHELKFSSPSSKEEVTDQVKTDPRSSLSPDQQLDALSYACMICYDGGMPISVKSVEAILEAANCPIAKDIIEEYVKGCSSKFGDLLEVSPSINNNNCVEQDLQVDPSLSDFDEKKAEEEYTKLKEKYDNEHFNFKGLKVSATPLCPYILPKVKNTIYVLLEIKVGKKQEEEKKKRSPYAVSIVLDRSGSMSGSKLDKAKAAVKGVLDKLEAKDVLHLIQYDSRADVVFQNGSYENRLWLQTQVDRVGAGGSTNLSDGLDLGMKTLLQNKKAEYIEKIFLFSDGCATDGITSTDGLCKLVSGYYDRGVGTSSFGIGADFNEQTMKGISDSGRGHYFFIDSSDQIPSIVEKAFRGLSRTVASKVMLKVKGTKGRQVRKFNTNEDAFKGIPLGDMREKDFKQIMLEVEVEEGEAVDPIEVLEFELSYEKMDDFIPDGPIKGSLSLNPTDNHLDLRKLNDDVIVFLRIYECGEMDKTVLKLLDANQLNDAIEVKKRVVEMFSEVVHMDKIGFAHVLLIKSKRRLNDLILAKTSRSSKSLAAMKKEEHKASEEAEDADMGFGLFD